MVSDPAWENTGFSVITEPCNLSCLWLNKIVGSEIPLSGEIQGLCAIATFEVYVKWTTGVVCFGKRIFVKASAAKAI